MSTDSRIEEVRDLIAQVRRADPGCRVFGSDKHRHALTPIVSQREIAAFERTFGLTLPEEYRCFLRTVGGGGRSNCVGPYYGVIGLDEIARLTDPDELARPFLLQPGGQLTDEQRDRGDDYAGSLELCSMGCGNFYRLGVNGPQHGQVWASHPVAGPDELLATGHDFIEWYAAWARVKLEIMGNERIAARIRAGMSREDVSALGGVWAARQVREQTFFEAPHIPVQLVLDPAGRVAKKIPWPFY